ncbi:MAG: DNA cytosine methyltransferase [Pirellulales bacterium]|nr:DNA cytosine methyltransferase [Pirellulales bacterium]
MSHAPSDKTFCEFFAGIGLVDEALRQSGWQCVYANDIDAKKRQMYAGHYGDAAAEHYHEGDVWAVDDVLTRIPGRPFLATASFPCTDMSLAGKRRGLAGEQSGALFGFLQVLEQLGERRPSVILLENVPGFLTSHDGEDFATAVGELATLGYWVDSFVIDARWFVPQSRPRLFLVGYHRDIVAPPLIAKDLDAEPMADLWQQAIARADRLRPPRLLAAMDNIEPATGWATIDCGNPPRQSRKMLAAIIDADDEQVWWNDAEVDRHSDMMFDRHRRQIEALREQGDGPVALTAFRRVREGQQRMEVRFDGVAGCLRTPRGGSAKQIVIVIDRGEVRMRWMTPREYARLQGAGGFALPENTIQALFGFGDAVCVPVIEWIDRNMLTPVYEAARVRGSGFRKEALVSSTVAP